MLFEIPSILFAFIGAMLTTVFPVIVIKRALAVFIIAFSIYSILKPKFKLQKSNKNALLGGSLSGFFAGLIGLGGAIRSTFLMAFNLPKEIYIGTSAMIALVVDLTRIPTYLVNKVVQDNSYYILVPFLFVSAYFGVRTGKVLLGKMSQEVFRKIVLTILLIMGIKLLFLIK
jgi:uncharacterized membrane protein YfcA